MYLCICWIIKCFSPDTTLTLFNSISIRVTIRLRSARTAAKSDYELRDTCLSVCPSTWNNSGSKGRIFVKFYISVFFGGLLGKLKFHYSLFRIKCTLLEGVCAFIIISL